MLKSKTMNTKVLMIASAFTMGFIGMALSFLPQEIDAWLGLSTHPVVLQLIGAAYLGFAMTNWTAKANLIGGIYGKPVAAGNFIHFTVGALALIKMQSMGNDLIVWIATVLYSVYALLFGYVFFTHPKLKNQS